MRIVPMLAFTFALSQPAVATTYLQCERMSSGPLAALGDRSIIRAKVVAKTPLTPPPTKPVSKKRWTNDDYERAVAAGDAPLADLIEEQMIAADAELAAAAVNDDYPADGQSLSLVVLETALGKPQPRDLKISYLPNRGGFDCTSKDNPGFCAAMKDGPKIGATYFFAIHAFRGALRSSACSIELDTPNMKEKLTALWREDEARQAIARAAQEADNAEGRSLRQEWDDATHGTSLAELIRTRDGVFEATVQGHISDRLGLAVGKVHKGAAPRWTENGTFLYMSLHRCFRPNSGQPVPSLDGPDGASDVRRLPRMIGRGLADDETLMVAYTNERAPECDVQCFEFLPMNSIVP